MSQKIEPTNIEPTKIEPTNIEPTNIEPTNIEPTNIEPTDIKPTNIEPTEIKPTDIKPTDINSIGSKTNGIKHKYSAKTAGTYFIAGFIGSIATLLVGLNNGLSLPMIPIVLGTLALIIGFFKEIKKMEVTQADLDKWNNEILAKHPNYNHDNLMTLESYNKSALNRFSYWTHTFKISATKVLACVMLPVAVLSVGAGIVVPLTQGNIGGSSNVSIVGTYVSESINSGSSVVVTAYKFNSNKTYQLGYYDKEDKKYTWTGTYNYSQSGSKVTVNNGYFTIKNGGKKLVGSDGSYFIRV